MKSIILASSSPYRSALLQSLGLAFEQHSPDIDETPLSGESPKDLSRRLAIEKAEHIAKQYDAWVIGSDQVAEIDHRAVGKPGNYETAFSQLQSASGKAVAFYTTVALAQPGAQTQALTDTVTVVFRTLSDGAISRYLHAESPYDCAGGFKSEGLGVSLFERIESQQPGSLIGLPMISTCRLLREAGLELP